MFKEAIAGIQSPNAALLYTTVTGDIAPLSFFPLNAVRWLTSSRNIAALVTDSGANKFGAQLYHFGSRSRNMSAELYLLDPGEYEMSIYPIDSKESPLETQTINVNGHKTRISFQLPAKSLCQLSIKHISR